MALICGIDEAGRGPIVGPLVMAGVVMDEKNVSQLEAMGVKDSKLLTEFKRNELFDEIQKVVAGFEIIVSDASVVDDAVFGKNGLNLNKLELKNTVEIISKLKPDTAIVDSPTANTEKYGREVGAKTEGVKIISENKADLKYVIVGAASILAKVTRDRLVAEMRTAAGVDFGSGYLSDPKTEAFLTSSWKSHATYFRKSWQPYQDKVVGNQQTGLGAFTAPKKLSAAAEKKVERLKELGYVAVDPKTSHEVARYKGGCTVIFYTNGNVLVQGKAGEKERVEKVIS